MKYIAWVEGLSVESGEKIKSIRKSTEEEKVEYGFGEFTYEITYKLTESLRFHKKDLEEVFSMLGVSSLSFHVTTYTPKGTQFSLKNLF